MSNQQPKPKPATGRTRQSAVKVIRRGAVAASIWRRQTPTGFEYLDFSLSRSWKLKSGKRKAIRRISSTRTPRP